MDNKGKLEAIDDIRTYANLLMLKNPDLDYAEASKRAKRELFGPDLNIPQYDAEAKNVKEQTEGNVSYEEIASKELSNAIRVELYTEDQLKEIIIAKRMGINVEEFINIFYTPMQIRVITMAASLGKDINPYITNLYFDPEEEMRRLETDTTTSDTDNKIYLLDKGA